MRLTATIVSKNGLDSAEVYLPGGQYLIAKSRHGSGHALAREIRATGFSDCPIDFTDSDGRILFRFDSWLSASEWTIGEGPTGEKRLRFKEFASHKRVAA